MRVRNLTRPEVCALFLACFFSLSYYVAGAQVSDYLYLNCYADGVDKDLSGQQITYGAITTTEFIECAAKCSELGYPYMGIQAMTRCYCGSSYGKYGISTMCNYTCSGTIQCGGVTTNDVFYSISKAVAREDVVFTIGKTFENARSTCVGNNGDILSITSQSEQTNVLNALQSNGITSGKVWQGMIQKGNSYNWTQAHKGVFTSNTYTSYWIDSETHQNPCVVINIADGKWESTACSASYPFICNQAPPPDAPPTSDDETGTEDPSTTEKSSKFDASKLSLYIVLPLFGLCYGGSCILYCSHKIYKNFKRKKRQKMLLSRLEDMPDNHSPPPTEYEPHNKPKYQNLNKPVSARPLSGGKRAAVHPMMGPPIQNGYFAENKQMPEPDRGRKTPIENIRIPSPRPQEKKEDVEDGRPDTTRDVELNITPEPARESTPEPTTLVRSPPPDLGSPPPPIVSATAIGAASSAVDAMKLRGTQSAKSKTEVRRQKLLEKALREARERRRKETGDTPVPPPSEPVSPPQSSAAGEDQWAQPTRKRGKSPKYGDETDSGDSSVNLLSDSERGRSADPDTGRDPTTMSIQEILRMKVAAKQERRRPKKILSA